MKIAVLGFGSLINNLHSANYGGMLEVKKPPGNHPIANGLNIRPDSPFVPVDGLKLPVRLGRISGAGTPQRRITMVLCQGASDETVYFADSKFDNLNQAIQNLKEREGLASPQAIGYVNVSNGSSRSRMQGVAERVSAWAKANGYDAVIWTDLEPKGIQFEPGSTGREIIPLLEQDPLLRQNTQKYIRDLPIINALQNKILNLDASAMPSEAPAVPASTSTSNVPQEAPIVPVQNPLNNRVTASTNQTPDKRNLFQRIGAAFKRQMKCFAEAFKNNIINPIKRCFRFLRR